MITWRGLRTATRAPDRFGAFLAVGLTAMIAFQALLNISVVIGTRADQGHSAAVCQRRRFVAADQSARDGDSAQRVAAHVVVERRHAGASRWPWRSRMHDAAAHRHRRGRNRRAPVSGDCGGARVAAPRAGDGGDALPGPRAGIESRVVPREGFELDVLRSAGLKGMSLVVAGARAVAAAAERARRVEHRVAPAAAAGDWRRRLQLGSGRAGRRAAAAFRRSCSSRTPCPASPIAAWRRLSAPRLSRSSRRCRTSGGGALSQAIRFVPSSLTDAPAAPLDGPPRILIFGGSQGAHAINMAMVEAAPQAGSPRRRAGSHASDRRTRSGARPGRLSPRRPRSQGRAVPLRHGPRDESRRPRDLPRRGDDAGRADGGGQAVAARPAADRRRRSPAQERRSAGGGRRGRAARAVADDGRDAGRIASSALAGRPVAPARDVRRGATAGQAGRRARRSSTARSSCSLEQQ